MKKVYLVSALMLGTLASSNAQVIFSSSFENWTGTTPDDWMGVKTNIPAANVTQVTGDSDYGNNAVRLTETTTSHKRFTTEGFNVTDGTSYQIKFWAKGQGDVRTGMMDSRPGGGFGFAYNAYIEVNSTTWTEYTQNIVCANDTTGAEFIFSVKETVAPNHIMIDSVVISIATVTNVSIYAIQFTSGSGASPLAGTTVNTGGIVTAKYGSGYYLQSTAGGWRGIKVFDAAHSPNVGDSITLTAQVQENFDNTELTAVSVYNVVNTGNPLPGPTVITTTQGNAEEFEGVYARVTSVCKDANAGFGMWTLFTAPDSLLVDDIMYAFTPTFNATYQVTGVMDYSFSERKILPRNAADVVLITSVEEDKFGNLHVYPNPADAVINLSNLPAGTTVQVIDLTGKTLVSSMVNSLNVSDLANGAYLVKVTNDNATKTYKLVVRH